MDELPLPKRWKEWMSAQQHAGERTAKKMADLVGCYTEEIPKHLKHK
jgi:hypothetical protein